MNISGWGRHPVIDSNLLLANETSQFKEKLQGGFSGIVYANGRSYGDSALSDNVLLTSAINHFVNFDDHSGVVTCEAGVLLADLIDVFVPKGWFLPVTPGTKFVTVGGAIASDVHGKNHHHDGCFSKFIIEFDLMLPSGDIVTCSNANYSDLFHATCGGMGLTGIILKATLRLKKIASATVNVTTIKAESLTEVLELFDEHDGAAYSVAWLDCLKTGSQFGRSLLMLGEHAESGSLVSANSKSLAVPVEVPGFVLNNYSISMFNHFYYQKVKTTEAHTTESIDKYFYPLDGIHHWNRLYGKHGFVQYQFVIPRENGKEGLAKILTQVVNSRKASFLSVLKLFGPENSNYLSFPMEGYTMALDFAVKPDLWRLLDHLDELVLQYGGRVYLAKDARMSEQVFKQSYPRWEKFVALRKELGADKILHSLQSQRLGI
jgi:decaprenylphospho-beta-D-ribofuranose 2-oxidase